MSDALKRAREDLMRKELELLRLREAISIVAAYEAQPAGKALFTGPIVAEEDKAASAPSQHEIAKRRQRLGLV